MPLKRKVRTFEEKWWVLELRKAHPKYVLAEVAKRFKAKWKYPISVSLLSDWGKPAFMKSLLDQSKLDHKRVKTKTGKYTLLETALHIWYLSQEEQDSTLLEFVLVEKARKLVELPQPSTPLVACQMQDLPLLGEAGAADAAKDEFLFSRGWFHRFKNRFGIKSRVRQKTGWPSGWQIANL